MARQTRSQRRARREAQAQNQGGVTQRARARQAQIRPGAQPAKSQAGAQRRERRSFVAESWAELKKVEWPGQSQVNQAPRVRRVVVPTEQVIETKDGQKVQTDKRVLPGYVLVNMDLNDEAWSVVKNTPGVTGFVGAGAKPVPLSQPEVDRILHAGVPVGGQAQKAQVEFSLGESVKVTSGPLSDFDGEIVDVNPDQQKLKVLVDIFERQVPVELGFDQVKKLD